MCYLLDETDPESNLVPLFEIQMDLGTITYFDEKKNIDYFIAFTPSLPIEDENGFFAFYQLIVSNISKMGSFIDHIDPDRSEENFSVRILVEPLFS